MEPSVKAELPRKCRFFRFSLRSLLMLILLIALAVGAVKRDLSRYHTERQIADRIEAAGGSVFMERQELPVAYTPTALWQRGMTWALGDDLYLHGNHVYLPQGNIDPLAQELPRLERLRHLNLFSTELSDRSVDALAQLTHLESLDLGLVDITPRQLRKLAALEHLSRLELSSSATETHLEQLPYFPRLADVDIHVAMLGESDIRQLAAVKKLKTLSLDFSSFAEAGDSQPASITRLAHLEALTLMSVPIDNRWFQAIGKLRSLRKLAIYPDQNEIDAASMGMQQLANLPNLQELLIHASVDDESLRAISKIPNLQRFTCEGSRITDAGVKHLAAHPSLEELHIGGAKVTLRGLRDLASLRRLDTVTLGGGLVINPSPAHASIGCGTCDSLYDLSTTSTIIEVVDSKVVVEGGDAGVDPFASNRNATSPSEKRGGIADPFDSDFNADPFGEPNPTNLEADRPSR